MSASSDLLEKAALLWKEKQGSARDLAIEIGRILHLYILAALNERADLAPELSSGRMKIPSQLKRAVIVKRFAKKLDVATVTMHQYLLTAMVVDLMSDGSNLRDMTIHKIRQFARFIIRRQQTRPDARWKDKFENVTAQEEWIGTEHFKDGCVLFRAAVQSSFSVAEIKRKVSSICGPVNPKKRRQNYEKPLSIDVSKTIKVCSSREAADLIYAEVMNTRDPKDVGTRLREMLSSASFDRDLTELNRKKHRKKAS